MSAAPSNPLRRSSRISRGSTSKPYDKSISTKKKPTKRTGPKSKAKMPASVEPTGTNGNLVYLRVNKKFLYRFATATNAQPNPPLLSPDVNTNLPLNVIIADRESLQPYAGTTVNWLIKIARIIFEPRGMSHLYTFTEGTVEEWVNKEMEPELWKQVESEDHLEPTIYEFRPDNDSSIEMIKMSKREMKSKTTRASQSRVRSSTIRTELLQRDRVCILSRNSIKESLMASHLLPKRLGDSGVQSVFQRFAGCTRSVDRYSSTIGVLLNANMDRLASAYCVGFLSLGNHQYVVHTFTETPINNTAGEIPSAPGPSCHGHRITLSSHDPNLTLPPDGVFDWHYVQCVLKKFATADYKAFENILYFTHPFRTEEEDDDESESMDFDDERNIQDPPYPSYFHDLCLFRAAKSLEEDERRQAVKTWRTGLS